MADTIKYAGEETTQAVLDAEKKYRTGENSYGIIGNKSTGNHYYKLADYTYSGGNNFNNVLLLALTDLQTLKNIGIMHVVVRTYEDTITNADLRWAYCIGNTSVLENNWFLVYKHVGTNSWYFAIYCYTAVEWHTTIATKLIDCTDTGRTFDNWTLYQEVSTDYIDEIPEDYTIVEPIFSCTHNTISTTTGEFSDDVTVNNVSFNDLAARVTALETSLTSAVSTLAANGIDTGDILAPVTAAMEQAEFNAEQRAVEEAQRLAEEEALDTQQAEKIETEAEAETD